jgi:hypothetical protein
VSDVEKAKPFRGQLSRYSEEPKLTNCFYPVHVSAAPTLAAEPRMVVNTLTFRAIV